jgi:glycosyltransferase involved in cell wall biosynthesis
VFVLASLKEGLPNALIEAALSQTAVVVHPNDGARSIVRDATWMTDLTGAGNLAARLMALRSAPPSAALLRRLREDVATRFGDRHMAKKFVQMVRSTCEQIDSHGATGA